MKRTSITVRAVVSATLLAALTSCGSGTFGIFAASGSSSSSGNAATVGSELAVSDGSGLRAGRSPACVSFLLTDEEGDAADCEVFVDGRLITLAPGSASLTQVPSGATHTVLWDFLADLGDEAFHEGLTLSLNVLGGISPAPLVDVETGNDAPVILRADPPPGDEATGVVAVVFEVADASADRVDILAEYDVVGDGVDDWQAATVSGTPPVDLETSRSGIAYNFVWDSVVDLGGRELDVRLRFRGRDRPYAELGSWFESPIFTIDNNAAPLALLDAGQLLANPDRRRGIPLPFEIVDDEGDLTQVVVQWRRPEESFPSLPSDPAQIRAILDDPVQRREYQIATEYPTASGGFVVPLGASAVRLPELGSTASRLLADGIVGRELEILRPSKLPQPVAAGWSLNSLANPVAALPLEDPLALVLDRAGGGRLAWVDLATGEVQRVVTTAGAPSAMAFEPGARTVVVASDAGGTWQLERVELETGLVTPLISAAAGSTERGTVRGLVCLGRDEALITVGNSLVHLRYPAGSQPSALALREDLVTPWGVVVDPWNANRIYLAERDAGSGRVSTFSFDERVQEAVVTGFARPTSIAFDPGTARLLAVTGDGRDVLSGVDLGDVGGNAAFELALLPGPAEGLATGPEGLRLVTLTTQNELLVGGGVQQRRTIESHDPMDERVEVDRPFEPALGPFTPWRITPSAEVVQASSAGTRRNFVWDSRDLGGGGRALFRVTPFDSERGRVSESPSSKEVLSPFELVEDAVVLGGPGITDQPVSGVAADLDGDGDLDLVSANAVGHTLTIFFQDAGSFLAPLVIDIPIMSSFNYPVSVAAGDLDGDGDLDLVTANGELDQLHILLQTSPGAFDSVIRLGNAGDTNFPRSVAIADLDADGDLDVVSANHGQEGDPRGNNLAIFFQTDPLVFDRDSPTRLGSRATTFGPRSVATADLNGDGKLDVVSANERGNNLTVFLQPDGGFVNEEEPSLVVGGFETTNRPRSVAAADLDQDGDLDLVSANLGPRVLGGTSSMPEEGSNLTVFFQTAAGVFDQPPILLGDVASTQDPSYVVPVDLDGDGDLDLAATVQVLEPAGSSSNLAFYFQTDPGVFTSTPLILGDADTTGSPAALAAGDLDGDGGVDVVSFNSGQSPTGGGDDLTIFGHVEPGRPDRAPGGLGIYSRSHDVLAADLDRDGDLDLHATNTGFIPALIRFSQRSPGVFDDGTRLAEIDAWSQAIADLDGDGDLDVVVGRFFAPELLVYLQSPTGQLVPSLSPLVMPQDPGYFTVNPRRLLAADLNGDGRRDLVSANWAGPHLTLFLQDDSSPGEFDEPQVLTAPGWSIIEQQPDSLSSFGPSSVVAADLDGDGDLDLASENATYGSVLNIEVDNPGGNVTLFLQASPGVFGPPAVIETSTSVTRGGGEIGAADLDGDGDLDLFTANSFGDDLTLLYQRTPGSFAPAVALGDDVLTNRPIAIEAADLDLDGDLDLISANSANNGPMQGGGSVTVFEQNAAGRFDANPIRLVAPSLVAPMSLEVVDLDGDGELDVITSDELSGELTIFYGGRD